MLKCFFDALSHDQIVGWAIDTENPHESLKLAVFVNGRRVARTVANRQRPDLVPIYGSADHGFVFALAPALSSTETHRISVRDVTTNKILSETYLFASSFPDFGAEICPIVLTSTGRCGTTLMMDVLSNLPGVVVAGHYPHEIKLLTYYAQAAKVLCSPAYEDFWRDPSEIHIDPTRLGLNPFFNHQFSNVFHDRDRLYSFFGQFSTDTILNAFREILQEFYKTIALDKKIDTPRYFAEKYDVLVQNKNFLRLLFPNSKEILLVRDLRDAYCSAKSFWSVRPDFIERLVEAKNALLRHYAQRDKNFLLVKYEDLVERKSEVVASIAAFLAVPISREARLQDDSSLFKLHGTSSTPSSSIGRWKQDLKDNEVAAFSERFSDFHATFGYEP